MLDDQTSPKCVPFVFETPRKTQKMHQNRFGVFCKMHPGQRKDDALGSEDHKKIRKWNPALFECKNLGFGDLVKKM